MARKEAPAIEAFNRDAEQNTGYLYTTNASLSSRTANKRLTDATLEAYNFQGKRVLDVGCGDGKSSIELYDLGNVAEMIAFDPASGAINVAAPTAGSRKLSFEVQSAYELPYETGSWDVAFMRGVLHHMDRPQDAIKEAFRVATELVIVEPNGYNPMLKALEKFSSYHIEHGEKSYAPMKLRRWIREAGGEVTRSTYAGLVPFFCPDWVAHVLKVVEPVAETVPGIRQLSCAVNVVTARRVL